MASEVDICNMAVSHLGSRAQITSIRPADGTAEAGHCARFYPIARKEAMESGTWGFNKRRVRLAPAPENASATWRYAYAKPSDCIKALRILQASFLVDYTAVSYYTSAPVSLDDLNAFNDVAGARFEIEGDVIYANEADAVLLYAVDVVDTTKWSARFTSFVSYLLASYLAGPILTGVDGATAAGKLRQIAAVLRSEAALDDANQSSSAASDFVPSWLARR